MEWLAHPPLEGGGGVSLYNFIYNISFKTQIMHFMHLLIILPLNEFNHFFRCLG